MSRPSRPWYSHEKRCWMAHVKRKKIRLVMGPEDEPTRKEAEKKLRVVLKGNPEKGALRVCDVIDRYLALHRPKYSEDALADRERYLNHFKQAHGKRKVNDRDCLPVHVEEWVASHPEWESDWTKAHAVSIVMRPFNWAAKKRLIPANPFRGVEQAEGEPRRPMTDAEFSAVLKNATVWKKRKRTKGRYLSGRKVCPSDLKRRTRPSPAARFRQVLVFLRFSGARPGEARHLLWTDIDLDNRVIVLRTHKTSKKTKKPRVIPLDPVIVKLLIFIRRLNQPGEHVFLTTLKTPWSKVSLSQRLRRVRQAAGVPEDAKLYGLRHGFAVRAITNGLDIKTLSALLGHTTARTTEHYLTHFGKQHAHLADAMSRANRGSR